MHVTGNTRGATEPRNAWGIFIKSFRWVKVLQNRTADGCFDSNLDAFKEPRNGGYFKKVENQEATKVVMMDIKGFMVKTLKVKLIFK
jgi:hypothetical protein